MPVLRVALAAFFASILGHAALADVIVLKSTDPRYQRNDRITLEQAKAVRAGAYLEVLDGSVTKRFGVSEAASGVQIGGVRGLKRKQQ